MTFCPAAVVVVWSVAHPHSRLPLLAVPRPHTERQIALRQGWPRVVERRPGQSPSRWPASIASLPIHIPAIRAVTKTLINNLPQWN
jgi:hypothetical protein